MDDLHLVSLVFFGNAAFAVYFWCIMQVAKGDKRGDKLEDLPWRVLLPLIIIPLVFALPLILAR